MESYFSRLDSSAFTEKKKRKKQFCPGRFSWKLWRQILINVLFSVSASGKTASLKSVAKTKN